MEKKENDGPVFVRSLSKVTIDVKDFVLKVEEERRSVLLQTWSSVLAALASLVVGVISSLAAAQPIFQVVRERWVILVAILVSSTTVALTATFALRQSRKARRLTGDVIDAYKRALNASSINPSAGASTRG